LDEESRFTHIIKTIGILVSIVAVIALGIYLSATQAPSYKGKTIIRWVVDPNPIRKETIALFESKNSGIHVINDPDAGAQRLLTQVAGGVSPDVMALYSTESVRMFARNDILLDLKPYIKKYNIPFDELYPQLSPYMYYKDKIVGVTENCSTISVYYNKKMFDKAGLPYPKPGWTWDDCVELGKKLTLYKTIGDRKVVVQKGLCVTDLMSPCFTWMYGGRMFSPDGKKCVLDSPEAKKGWRFWADLRLKYHITPSASEAQSMAPTGGWGGDYLLFAQGKVAMMFIGRFLIPEYRKQTDLEWGAVDLPRGPNPMNMFFSKTYSIPKTCKNKDAAIKFVRHILSKENQMLIANFGDGFPVRRNKEITKGFLYNPQYPKETNNQFYIDSIKNARVPETSQYINSSDLDAIVARELGFMWIEKQTPDQTCDNIAKQVNAIIKRNIANPNFLD